MAFLLPSRLLSRMGVRTRVQLAATLPVVVLGIVMTTVLTSARLTELEAAHLERGQALVRQLAIGAEFALFAGDHLTLGQLVHALSFEPEVLGIAVLNREGVVIARAGQQILNATPQARTPSNPVDEASVLRLQESVYVTRVALRDRGPSNHAPDASVLRAGEEGDGGLGAVGRSERSAEGGTQGKGNNSGPGNPQAEPGTVAPTAAQGTRVQLGTVLIDFTREPLSAERHAALLRGILVLLLVLIGGVWLALVLGRSVSQPIRLIAQTVQRIGRGEWSPGVDLPLGGSLGLLAEGINEMAFRLQNVQEITQREVASSTQELRLRKEEAENSSLAKSRFLAAASHDLRQPMHALGLFVAELAAGRHSRETRQLIRQIVQCAESMEGLLDSLLDISRLDAGVLQPALQLHPIGNTLERLRGQFGPLAQARGLQLIVRPHRAWVNTDPVLLERILANFLTNALRYTSQGRIVLAARQRGDWLRIEVRDNGVGIAADQQEVIFQEFVQLHPEQLEPLDSPLRRNQGSAPGLGLGLGLTIVRRLAGLMGYRVSLRSCPGYGSTFALELPQAENPIQLPSEQDGTALGRLSAHVLLLSDQPDSLDATAELLSSWGLQVHREAAMQGPLHCDLLILERHHTPAHLAVERLYELCRKRRPSAGGLLIGIARDSPEAQMAESFDLRTTALPIRPVRLRTLLIRLLKRPPKA